MKYELFADKRIKFSNFHDFQILLESKKIWGNVKNKNTLIGLKSLAEMYGCDKSHILDVSEALGGKLL